MANPFRISIPEEDLEDLRNRITRTRWPEAETVEDWSQGVPVSYAKELAAYWASSYDWRDCEENLNRWPGFFDELDGQGIHYLHVRSPHDDALPMIITHGWPGSIIEFLNVIDSLTNPVSSNQAFHLVVPSLPGYGFSAKPSVSGTNVERIARLWHELMLKLGYRDYVAQGGDWGSLVTHYMAVQAPIGLRAVHFNMPIAPPDKSSFANLEHNEDSILSSLDQFRRWESGYSKIQSTRPQTLGYGLADSPVGQMTWIVEKFYAWTDCGVGREQHPEIALSRDEMLDIATMYWLTNSAASSARLYWESFASPNLDQIELPVSVTVFPREFIRTSRRWAERRYKNISYWNEVDRGGHFAALEQPDCFVEELRAAFAQFR